MAELERDADRLRISQAVDVVGSRAELLATMSLRDRVALLSGWFVDFPKATSQLFRVIARDPDASLELASTVLGSRVLDGDDAHAVLVTAFPKLTGALRDAAADRLNVGSAVTVTVPDPSWLWPAGKPFPPADSVEGVQARLNYLDLGAGPISGEWNDLTRRAFTRWQVLTGFEPTGELDDDSAEYLAFKTPEMSE
ncbi:MAG TPA: hypothetical protein VF403_25125 [Kofleriaceae bacterium]